MSKYAKAARSLAGLPGVVGVFRGVRRRAGSLTREPTLSIHVERKQAKDKLSREEQIPGAIDGIPTDVVAVGRPRLHSLVDSNDQLGATYDALGRRSSISAMASSSSGVLALGSGHGLLPVENGAILSGAWIPAAGRTVDVVGSAAGGTLASGQIGGDSDFALVSFADLDPSEVLLGHTFSPLPIPLAVGGVSRGDTVFHEASVRKYRISGTVGWLPIEGQSITLLADGAVNVTYQSVFGVTSPGLPFSLPAESGSTVFNQQRRAVGFVVGAGTDPDGDSGVSYVLCNAATLVSALGDKFSLFFQQVQS